jgi:hypothetical protein
MLALPCLGQPAPCIRASQPSKPPHTHLQVVDLQQVLRALGLVLRQRRAAARGHWRAAASAPAAQHGRCRRRCCRCRCSGSGSGICRQLPCQLLLPPPPLLLRSTCACHRAGRGQGRGLHAAGPLPLLLPLLLLLLTSRHCWVVALPGLYVATAAAAAAAAAVALGCQALQLSAAAQVQVLRQAAAARRQAGGGKASRPGAGSWMEAAHSARLAGCGLAGWRSITEVGCRWACGRA